MRTATAAIYLVLTVALTGCGVGLKIGPDYERPVDQLVTADTFATAGVDTSGVRIDHRWWTVFRDEELDSLVEEAIRNNLDIKRASAVVLELRARNTQARADRIPSISLKGDYQRQEYPSNSFRTGAPTTSDTESFNASLAASHELDLWGAVARAHEAARADLLQSIEKQLVS